MLTEFYPLELQHDPFQRATLMRLVISKEMRRPCRWCAKTPGRFRYWWEGDEREPVRWADDGHGFCGINCWRAFHKGMA